MVSKDCQCATPTPRRSGRSWFTVDAVTSRSAPRTASPAITTARNAVFIRCWQFTENFLQRSPRATEIRLGCADGNSVRPNLYRDVVGPAQYLHGNDAVLGK